MIRSLETKLRRVFRKNGLALGIWVAYLTVVFFPTLFMARVLSPNDVYFHYDPWHAVASVEAQNPLIHDPPMSYYTLVAMMRNGLESFHWNRFVASGIPGGGSAASAILSPFILIPGALLPMVLFYTGVIVLKFSAGFFFSYLWLREERLGKRGAAIGALVAAAAGSYSVLYLWQATNTTVLYPAVLLSIARIFHGKKNSVFILVVLVSSLLLSGYPATIVLGAWVAGLYVVFLAIRGRFVPWRELGKGVAAAVLALLIVAPFLAPFVQFLNRTGYLEMRDRFSYGTAFPIEQLVGFVDPYHQGDPAQGRWIAGAERGAADNFVENTVYLGLATLALLPLGVVSRKRGTLFWTVFGVVVVLALFGGLGTLLSGVPGIRYSPLTRLRLLVPIPAAFLAAAGSTLLLRLIPRLPVVPVRSLSFWALSLWLVYDLGMVAGRFYSYVEPEIAVPPETRVGEFLRGQPQPFRIAPSFTVLMPNSAQMVGVEDIRVHWGMEKEYRRMLERIDPSVAARTNIALFNSLQTNFSDPLLSMLGVRYVIEPPPIDIIRWKVYDHSKLSADKNAEITLHPGDRLTQQVDLDFDPMYSVEFTLHTTKTSGVRPGVVFRVFQPETGEMLLEKSRSAEELTRDPKAYLPLDDVAVSGNVVIVEIESHGVEATMAAHVDEDRTDVLYGKVSSPLIYDSDLPGGRIYENIGAMPRYWASWTIVDESFDDALNDPKVDFTTKVVSSGLERGSRLRFSSVPAGKRRARFRILHYASDDQRIETEADVPFFLVTSEKLTPELRVTVDGKGVVPVAVNALFAGVPLEPGRHEVAFERRIGRGWWPTSLLAVLATLGIGWVGVRSNGIAGGRSGGDYHDP